MSLALTDLLSPDVPVQGDLCVGVPVNAFPRLAAALTDGKVELDLDVRVRPLAGAVAALAVEGRVAGTLPLCCQRCLETVPIEIEQTLNLAVAAAGDEEQLPAGFEPWPLVAGPVSLGQLLEDELLLSLPLAPVHDDPKSCGPLADTVSSLQHEGTVQAENPFALLKDLKR
ncbi:MAG: YceD family protein [Gammaproteobacteria bacterium]